jgi:D-serine deaminase-like pyridoxal phosphate-dependent protein
MTVDELPTPCLVVDLDVLERNVSAWQRDATVGGARFRPHVKTHKTLELARMQVRAGACGITAAKVGEAEVYVAAGLADVVVAYPVFGEGPWRRLARLASGARIGVNVENGEAAEGLSRAATGEGVEVDVHLDLDTGLGRCGVPVADREAVRRLADLVDRLPGLRPHGVTTYRGVAFDGAPDPAAAGREEAQLAVAAAAELGLRDVAVGSTPTGRAAAKVAGVTEVRAGTYVFNDLMQVGVGAAEPEDCALSIWATVVSVNRPGRVTVDAGSKTFSGDAVLAGDRGRMLARSTDGAVVIDGLTEEHGVGSTSRPVRVGERIAFTPAHVCTTVNLSDELVAARRGKVEAVWAVAARGRRT